MSLISSREQPLYSRSILLRLSITTHITTFPTQSQFLMVTIGVTSSTSAFHTSKENLTINCEANLNTLDAYDVIRCFIRRNTQINYFNHGVNANSRISTYFHAILSIFLNQIKRQLETISHFILFYFIKKLIITGVLTLLCNRM